MFALLCLISCQSGKRLNTNDQPVAVKNNFQLSEETDVNTSQFADKPLPDGDAQTFAKTFFIKSRYDDSTNTIVHHPYLIEFKDDNSKGIGIYIDGKRKAFSKFENNTPELRADFLETNGDRYFVLVIAGAGTGTCGDGAFAVAKLDGDLKVRISRPNEPDCQGELYPIKIENIDKLNKYYRRISVGDLKFNVDSFEWENK